MDESQIQFRERFQNQNYKIIQFISIVVNPDYTEEEKAMVTRTCEKDNHVAWGEMLKLLPIFYSADD